MMQPPDTPFVEKGGGGGGDFVTFAQVLVLPPVCTLIKEIRHIYDT